MLFISSSKSNGVEKDFELSFPAFWINRWVISYIKIKRGSSFVWIITHMGASSRSQSMVFDQTLFYLIFCIMEINPL